MILDEDDFENIEWDLSDELNEKAVGLYRKGEYETAVEYYRIAASMGNVNAISNLGYCYLYGRDIPKNESLGLAYLMIASDKGDIMASYKIGDIYNRGLGVEIDREKALACFEKAFNKMIEEKEEMGYGEAFLEHYPSLYLSYAQEFMPGGLKEENLPLAYDYLLMAKRGYDTCIEEGDSFYIGAKKLAISLLNSEIFTKIKNKREERLNSIIDKLEDYIKNNYIDSTIKWSLSLSPQGNNNKKQSSSEGNFSFLKKLDKENNLDDYIKKFDVSKKFSKVLFDFIDNKKMTDSECYKKAGIDRRLFSKIKCDENYHPAKRTVISLILALELNLDEANELLESAEYSLSHNFYFDIIIEFCIINKIFNLMEVNEILDKYDQFPLSYTD